MMLGPVYAGWKYGPTMSDCVWMDDSISVLTDGQEKTTSSIILVTSIML